MIKKEKNKKMINGDKDRDQEIYYSTYTSIAFGRNFDFREIIDNLDNVMKESKITRDGLTEIINGLSDKNAIYIYFLNDRLYQTFIIPLEHKGGVFDIARFYFGFDKSYDIKDMYVLTAAEGHYCKIQTSVDSTKFYTTVWGKSNDSWYKMLEYNTLRSSRLFDQNVKKNDKNK